MGIKCSGWVCLIQTITNLDTHGICKKGEVHIDVVMLCLGQDTQAVCTKTLEQQQLLRVSKASSLVLLAVSFCFCCCEQFAAYCSHLNTWLKIKGGILWKTLIINACAHTFGYQECLLAHKLGCVLQNTYASTSHSDKALLSTSQQHSLELYYLRRGAFFFSQAPDLLVLHWCELNMGTAFLSPLQSSTHHYISLQPQRTEELNGLCLFTMAMSHIQSANTCLRMLTLPTEGQYDTELPMKLYLNEGSMPTVCGKTADEG